MLFADLPSQVQRPFDRVFGEDLCFRVDFLRPEIAVYRGEVWEGGFGDFEVFVCFREGGGLVSRSEIVCTGGGFGSCRLPNLDLPSSLCAYVVKMTEWGFTSLSERDLARHSNRCTPSRSSEKWLKMRMARLDH